ncbi:hypothetical protein BJ875DRAFT_470419 [Amylocarpus encephaloides]|uniref:Indole-diterpene biosynthesis protein PaxU n=1 Tax=Amylocarpus encephaloides TaxID=45428 RepID=A0A9P8C2M6_9HELO|nr:hypothetical protein BJ875DRAFT_470419 [Amylocarpus encephaloides]
MTMAPAKASSGLDHFYRLSSSVFIHEPPSCQPSDGPDVVLFASWMDASKRHLAKYTAGYERLYPSARIMVITTTGIDVGLRTPSADQRRIAPILQILCALPPDTKILLHFASNGGAYTTIQIARAYRRMMGKSLPVQAMVMDSTPGKVRVSDLAHAFALRFGSNVLVRLVAVHVMKFIINMYLLQYWMRGVEDLLSLIWKDLNNDKFFGMDVSRAYIYSDDDQMVRSFDVEEHADEAERLGYRVERCNFGQSVHCSHLMKDEKRYWEAVDKVWRRI